MSEKQGQKSIDDWVMQGRKKKNQVRKTATAGRHYKVYDWTAQKQLKLKIAAQWCTQLKNKNKQTKAN